MYQKSRKVWMDKKRKYEKKENEKSWLKWRQKVWKIKGNYKDPPDQHVLFKEFEIMNMK